MTFFHRISIGLAAALQFACGSTSPSQPVDVPPVVSETFGRVMIIGMDGTRAEALAVASTPNLDAISSLGNRDINAITGDVSLSGPGWASMLTGVWCDKHNVLDNDASWSQSSFDTYPHFITRLEEAAPSRHTFQFHIGIRSMMKSCAPTSAMIIVEVLIRL